MVSLALTIPLAVSKIVSVGKKILPAFTSLKSFLDKSDLEAPVSTKKIICKSFMDKGK